MKIKNFPDEIIKQQNCKFGILYEDCSKGRLGITSKEPVLIDFGMVSVFQKSTFKPEQVIANTKASGIKLSDDVLPRIEETIDYKMLVGKKVKNNQKGNYI